MRILAIETATPSGSVALLDGPTLVVERSEAVPMHHLEWLAPTIDQVLGDVGWSTATIEGLAVSQGPGGFTGLRIGIATALAWARAREVPVVGIPTLAALALGVEAHGLVCPVLDARRDEVAAALFEHDGGVTRLMDDVVAPMDVILETLPADRPITFAGDGLERYSHAIEAARGGRASFAPRSQWEPRARAVGRLAWERLARGERDNPYTVWPLYARHPVFTDGRRSSS